MIIEYDNMLGGQIATIKLIKAAIKRKKLRKKLRRSGLSKKAVRKEMRKRFRKTVKKKLKKLHTAYAFISPAARAAKIALAIKNRKKIKAKLQARRAKRRAKRKKAPAAIPATTIQQQPVNTVESDIYQQQEYTAPSPDIDMEDYSEQQEAPGEYDNDGGEMQEAEAKKPGLAKFLIPAALIALPFLFGKKY